MTRLAIALAVLAVATPPLPGQTSDVALGIEALSRRDVRRADSAFARGASGGNIQLRPSALQWRAHVAWRLRADTAAASRFFDQALALSRFSSQVLLDRARFEGSRRRYRAAFRTGAEAWASSADAERRGHVARTITQLAADAVFSAPSQDADSVDRVLLGKVRDTLAARVQRFPGRTSDARSLIDAAAILGDTVAVREGLRSYSSLRPPGIVPVDSQPAETLEGALAAAGLHESAALLLRSTRPAGQLPAELRDIPAYARFLRDARALAEAGYRSALAGSARPGDMTRSMHALARRLWPQLRWLGPPPAFYPAGFYRELANRFGTTISIERSRGVEELHLSHRLGTYTVDAGGMIGTVVVLDGTVSAGIDDWLLDGTGGRAGWVANDTIYQRRTAFTETPFRALVALTDPQSMPGELLRITRDSIGDIGRVRRDSLGYLPGVAARMFRAGAMSLLDSLSRAGMSDRDRVQSFTGLLFATITRSSIVLHETRHLADARAGRLGVDAVDEFRAKLDEVAGATYPRLSLTAILTPNIGDQSAHGQANRRIMQGLARWIRGNGSAIGGYDPQTPALLQLPLLTDGQLRGAFESMRRP